MSVSLSQTRPFPALSSARANPNLGLANAGFLILLVIGVHTGLSLPVLPHEFLAFLAACGIFLVNIGRINRRVFAWFLLALVAMSIVAMIASTSTGVPIGLDLRATLNFIYNIFTGLSVYFALLRLGRERTRKLFGVLLLVLVIGAVLEVIGIVKPLSDWFRNSFLTSGIYDLDQRDLSMYGLIRPKFFASEPSILGLSISIAFYLWFTALRRPRPIHYMAAFLVLAVALFFVRSPVIVFGVIAYGLTVSITDPWKGRWKQLLRPFVPRIYAVGAILIPGLLLYLILAVPGTPDYFKTNSFFQRTIAPSLMALLGFRTHPLFGVGMGDDTSLTKLAIEAYILTGNIASIRTSESLDTLGASTCNAFWFTFITFGIAGTAVLAVMIWRLLKIIAVPVSLVSVCCVACFTFWMAFGRVNSAIAWFTFFVVAAACELRINQGKNAGLARTAGRDMMLTDDRQERL